MIWTPDTNMNFLKYYHCKIVWIKFACWEYFYNNLCCPNAWSKSHGVPWPFQLSMLGPSDAGKQVQLQGRGQKWSDCSSNKNIINHRALIWNTARVLWPRRALLFAPPLWPQYAIKSVLCLRKHKIKQQTSVFLGPTYNCTLGPREKPVCKIYAPKLKRIKSEWRIAPWINQPPRRDLG